MITILLTLISLIASCIGTVSGFGVGTILTPALLFFISFPQTILMAGIIHWFHDIWKVILFKGAVDWKLFFYFGLPAVIASFVGAQFLFISPNILLKALGIFLVVYALTLLFFPDFKLPNTKPFAVAGGATAGFFAGIFGIRGAISSMFLSAFDLKKAMYLSTVGAISFMIDSSRILAYVYEGIELTYALKVDLAFMVVASLAGAWIGSRLVHQIPQDYFRRVVAAFLLLAGVRLLFMA